MLTQPRTERPVCFADKQVLRQMMAELNEQLGIVPNPGITIGKLREMMRAEGSQLLLREPVELQTAPG